MKTTSKFFLLLSITALCFTSCNQSINTYSSSGDGLNDALNDPAFIDKYNAYVSLGNSVSPEVWTAYSWYIKDVDTINGTLHNKGYFNPTFSDAVPFEFTKINQLKDQKPDLGKLDSLVATYMEAHQNLRTPLVSLIDLQISKGLSTDNYALLKEKNPEVLKAFQNFAEVDTAITIVIEEMANDLNRVELERLKSEGLDIRYSQLVLMTTLRDHINLISEYNYQNINTIDLAVFAQKNKEVEEAFNAFTETTKDNSKVKEQLTNPTIVGIFDNTIKAYITASKELEEIAKDDAKHKKNVRTLDRSQNIDYGKTPTALVNKFSKIVSQSNSMM